MLFQLAFQRIDLNWAFVLNKNTQKQDSIQRLLTFNFRFAILWNFIFLKIGRIFK